MAKDVIENDIYASIIGECEKLEREGSYRGNGRPTPYFYGGGRSIE